ncbi:class I SAM-dependent methyltransferase [Aporhodopirellula aestuarii]|uniref:Class I SAM-dependent methyltransferase n=1 Tax=Aporhodopirellula aestuarii TaxID=2950107 RepID=A0ABT0UCR6_9BACT|nr:class I SAM-dependent methyltransferase [Aporhodopirellula aestuarii]MCM2374833.1 class I SAM-dependent methyltransferase [Aporhodopirellula aestuarii]
MIDPSTTPTLAPYLPAVSTGASGWTGPDVASFEFRATGSPFIDRIFETGELFDFDGQLHPMETYIPKRQGDLLYSLVRHLEPQRTLEIGLANGISALHIATGLQDNGIGHHLAIDPYQTTDWKSVGLASLCRAGLESWVSLDERPSHWAVPDLEQAECRVQFAFIDGSHLLDYVMTDFMTVDRILDVGGLIAFDDSDWPAVLHVIRFALTNRDYEVFPTGQVIEPSPGKPRHITRLVRRLVRRSNRLQRIVRPSFTIPDLERHVEGRCVVLRKTANDSRHALQGQPNEF